MNNRFADTMLALLFPRVSEQIRQQQEKIDRFKTEFRSIISGIREGLLVITAEGTITMANPAAETIFGLQLEDLHYCEALHNYDIIELIRRAIEIRDAGSGEISINNRHLIVKTAYLAPGNAASGPAGLAAGQRTLVIIYDVTDSRNLENIKKDFISNVSHELRTPLTAIKGFVETMRDDQTLNPHYLDVIHKHTERLINIVKDLLLLSKIEDASFKLNREPIDLAVLINDVVSIFKTRADQKGLDLTVAIEPGLPRITVDPFKIEQVLVNLVDNALKYTEPGRARHQPGRAGCQAGTWQGQVPRVCVGLKTQPGNPAGPGAKAVITVSDTGIGIPAEYHHRIFERFFVVDKSRSRKQGGTGLGLAIVKHIVLLHNGTISLDSQPGQGTIFTITLPL